MALRRSLRSWFTIVVVSILGLGVAPGLARAHTELDYSLPADGTSVGEPVDEIAMAFTSPVSLVGDGFRVLDPQNHEFSPVVVTDDDIVFRLQFDPPLAGATVAVRYEVRADDGHVVTVASAAIVGGYNHVVVVPALRVSPSDRSMVARARVTIAVEAVLLASVVAVTVFLTSASIT